MENDSQSRNYQNQNSKRQSDKKRTRRTRKDQDGRDFTCSCGKSYLSYPALYTHIKTKHDGKVPQKSNNQNQDAPVVKQDLQQLKMFLSKFYPQRLRGTPIIDLKSQLSIEQQQFIMPSLQYWDEVYKKCNQQKKQQKIISIRRIFAKLVYDMNKRINPSAIKFLIKLLMYVSKGICIQFDNPKYCDLCTASKIPSIFNQLIINKHIPINSNHKQKIFNDSQSIYKVLFYIAGWLFNMKYTCYCVKLRN